MKMVWHYTCTQCGRTYDFSPLLMVCPECSAAQKKGEPVRGILEVTYGGKLPGDFGDLLPVESCFFPSIPVGSTPLWKPERLREKTGFANLFLKDDTLNPSGSLKDRASFLVSACALKYHIRNIVVASTGNAASSMACIGAAADLSVKIFVPAAVPRAKMIQALQFGADVTLVDGNYDDAYEASLDYLRLHGGMSRNTAYNPLTIEGKKTAAFEIVRQIGGVPDVLFVPTGDGVILSGMYKGFRDLLMYGLIERMPVLYAVQADGSNAICRARKEGTFSVLPASTIADSLSVDAPKAGYYALSLLNRFGGQCISVADGEILKAQHELAAMSGLFAEPSSAAAYAGFLSVKDMLPRNAVVVLLITGNGLKNIRTAELGVSAQLS